jgi:hypothetical protein
LAVSALSASVVGAVVVVVSSVVVVVVVVVVQGVLVTKRTLYC